VHPINTELSPEFLTQRRTGLAPTTVAKKTTLHEQRSHAGSENRRGFCFLGERASNAKNRTNDGSNITAQPSKQGATPKSVTDFTVFHRGTLPTIHASLATLRVANVGIQTMVSVLLAGKSTTMVVWVPAFARMTMWKAKDSGGSGPMRYSHPANARLK
jgi:hypothetical protein